MANLIDPNGHFDDPMFPNKAYRREQKALAEKAAKKADSVFRQNVKTLKKFGFIDYDLRKPLSPYKQKKLKNLISEHNHIIAVPQDFVKRKVSKETKAVWHDKGYDTNSKYLIIPKNGYDKIHVTKDKIKRRNYDKSETVFAYEGVNLYNKLHQLENIKLKQYEYITVKIGKNAMFNTRFYSTSALMHYLSQWQPHDPKNKDMKDDLISQMSIVRFTDFNEMRNDYTDFSEDEDDYED